MSRPLTYREAKARALELGGTTAEIRRQAQLWRARPRRARDARAMAELQDSAAGARGDQGAGFWLLFAGALYTGNPDQAPAQLELLA